MKISVVIPAYNEEKGIGHCIEAVQQEIRRSGVEAEIIIANNASTDATRAVAEQKGVRVVDEPIKGIVSARKAGNAVATGDVIAHIDADSRMPEGWLTKVETYFRDEKLLALSGPYIYYDAPAYMRFFTKLFYIGGYILNKINGLVLGTESMLQGGNFVLRRGAIEKAGGFDTSIAFYGDDTDIGRRVSKVGKVLWTFSFPMNTSGRRLMKEGLVKTGWTYALNFFWITFFKHPHTKDYTDVRL